MSTTRRRRILSAEDDLRLQRLLQRTLGDTFDLKQVSSTDEALELLLPLAFPSGDTPSRPSWWAEMTISARNATRKTSGRRS